MSRTPHLLIVEDDREIRDIVTRFLTQHGYRVSTAKDGREMDKVLEAGRIDLIVLDLMLPGEDGLSICRRLRATPRGSPGGSSGGAPVPIVVLTAMGDETDRIIGLEMGADDYLAKPFNPRELLARIRAVLRRSGPAPEATPSNAMEFAGWRLDLGPRRLYDPTGLRVTLTGGEFELLVAFCQHPRRVLNRDQLLDLTHGRSAQAFDRSVDIQVSRLRRKIEPDPREPTLIQTVRSEGYMFTPHVTITP